ncbi:PREDICTED: mevalonate kinase-like [Vollenhovia emeryi]|uniref:mevalonate kinase-like n=1 Tax=Vollenhovia emeryi TaxID=411798 RepID=UPI0005F541E0|nr:PREDICTED: mevalonate kinase-like [Vollenhovia emeryi]
MIKFNTSAPNKLSLFGEHAVKYGKQGLTAGINLRTTLTFSELPHSEGIIQMYFLQINTVLNMPLRQFLDFYRNCTFNENNNELHDQVSQFIKSHCSFRTEHQRAIVQSFVYLLTFIAHEENIDIKSFCVHLSTQLLIDEDSVCLASFTVCLAACLLRWSRLQKGAIDDFDSSDLNKIFLYAVRNERYFHEFGAIDVAACTYGSIIHQIGEKLRYIPLFELINVKILLVDSKQTQNLEAQMQRVAELMKKCPEDVHSIFKSIDIATNMAANALQALGPIYASDTFCMETKRLLLMIEHNILQVNIILNQRLLRSLDVSHFSLDKIFLITLSYELCGKYTDIGSGRYAYIWCPPNTSIRHILRLTAELKTNSFNVTETTLACSGVKIEH